MTEMKWTPGTWTISENNARAIVSDSLDGFDPLTGENLVGGASSGPRALANAKLMAAAPEMAEALRDITDRFERALIGTGTSPEYAAIACAKARAALQKAGG